MTDSPDPEELAEQLDTDAPDPSDEGMRLADPTTTDSGEFPIDDEADAVAQDVTSTPSDLSAEEAAVNPTADPGMGEPGDGYLDE